MDLYILFRQVLASWVNTVRTGFSHVCARLVGGEVPVCERAMCAKSLDGCSLELVRVQCILSLATRFCAYAACDMCQFLGRAFCV